MTVHILIVDTDASAAEVTGAILRRIDTTATIAYAATPEQAWRIAQETPPDVLIIDPSSYGTAGILLIQLCRDFSRELRVIVIAARLTPALRKHIQHLGVRVYLEKPTASAVLVEQIRAGLRDHPATVLARPFLERTALS